MSGFDWPGLMRAGFQVLHLKPAEFWELTPAELVLMLGLQDGGTPVLTRAGQAELSAEYPDIAKT